MSTSTKIEWTETTSNPTTGCDRISPRCDHCYALTLAPRALGRVGIGVDLRPDYYRAARWRTFDPARAATTLTHTWAQRQTRLTDQKPSGR